MEFKDTIPIEDWSIDYFEKNTDTCLQKLRSLKGNNVPMLDKASVPYLKDGQLVRFQGMVQDMLNTEYFCQHYDIQNCDTGETIRKSGFYRDIAQCKNNEEFVLDTTNPKLNERQPLYCVPVPGLNSWAFNSQANPVALIGLAGPSHTDNSKKRNHDETMDTDAQEDLSTKRVTRPLENNSLPDNAVSNKGTIYPLPGEDGLACIVKVYDQNSEILLNDRIEVFGFLSMYPALEVKDDYECIDTALHPPASLVPRLHAIQVNKMRHHNPLLEQNVDLVTTEDCEKIKSELHLALTQVLYGDTLAADYLICHLISKIYVRQECLKLGHFSLNLSGITSNEYGKQLYDMIAMLVPQSHYLPLTIEHMNTATFVPKKDYTTNKLDGGFLQLAEDTELVVDETQLQEGRLNDTGCRNMAALHTLSVQQLVKYDFSFYKVDYNTDVGVLILSEGKSMIPASVILKLKIDPTTEGTINETFEAAKYYLNQELLNPIRKYLTSCKLQKFNIGDEVMAVITTDFVEMRQKDSSVKQDHLHTLLILARLVALSKGELSLSKESWAKAMQMEQERISRL